MTGRSSQPSVSPLSSPPSEQATRIVVVDDHAVLRDGLVRLITSEPDLEVVGEAGATLPALTLLRAVKADVILVDLSLPTISGFELLERLSDVQCIPAIVLSMHDDAATLDRCRRLGVRGFVHKSSAGSIIVEAIRAVASGANCWRAPATASPTPPRVAPGTEPDLSTLSARELEVLTGLGRGLTYQEIATDLGISVSSVGTYRKRLADKLSASSRSDFVRIVQASGLFEQCNAEVRAAAQEQEAAVATRPSLPSEA